MAGICTDKSIIESSILLSLFNSPISDSLEFSLSQGFDHDVVNSVSLSLMAAEMLQREAKQSQRYVIVPECEKYVKDGAPEFQLLKMVQPGTKFDELKARAEKELGSAACQFAMKKKLITKDKEGLVVVLSADAVDTVQRDLAVLHEGKELEEKDLKELKDRKLIRLEVRKSFSISKGPKYSRVRERPTTDLSYDLLKGDAWKSKVFKDYNFNGVGTMVSHGSLHPLLKVRTQLRSALLEMGFEEMPTNKYVESSFWNFDSLFQPQQHPARDSHDTFFVSTASETLSLPEEYVDRVQKMHEVGGNESIGWRYHWSLKEAKRNVLRTHTTAVSSRMLYQLAQEKEFKPRKYFSIDRVFRNETIDATHLAEFHQIEGLVADRNLSLCDLIGVIKAFFERIGMTQLKFKPAYNPYTEPSMEIFGFSSELNKWIEIGNSGIFRPEMLLPMGFPADVQVIAWGLSLERPTMIKYGIKHIRDLFGHKVDLNMCHHNPIAYF